jgi:ATP-dependent DNA ligase
MKSAHGEGIIVKNLKSPYGHGWHKIKFLKENDVAITGYTPGTGKRAKLFGALKMAVHTKKGLKPVGMVGTGFKDEDLRYLKKRLDAGDKIVGRVKFRKIGSQGSYIEPRWVAERTDLTQSQTHDI